MSELNVNTMSSEELKEQAKILGLSLKGNPSDETLRARIREALGQPDPDIDNYDDAETSAAATVHPGKERKAKIIISRSEMDKQPVFVGVNGKPYRIQRGVEVVVPESVVNVLRNAIQQIKNPETEEMEPVEAYPFSVVDWIG